MPSSSNRRPDRPLHVAIIMDGNGRWATRQGLPRTAGHRAGADAVRRVVETAPKLDIATLTLFAFSSDNWRRPPEEVAALMRLLEDFLRQETERCVKEGARVTVFGRRDRIAPALGKAIRRAERATAEGTRLHVRIALDYSSRESIARAALRLTRSPRGSLDLFARLLAGVYGESAVAPEVDLLIRTGGEKRLSDFLLWECAYAELFFTERMWPDFGADDLRSAVADFWCRERRFGGVPSASLPAGRAVTAGAAAE